MIDYVTCSIPVEYDAPIYGGRVISTRMEEEGEVQEYGVLKRLGLEGSHSSNIHIRCVDGRSLELKGNIAKWLQGHNLYGTDDLFDLLRRGVDAIFRKYLPHLKVPTDDQILDAQISRVDVTYMYQLKSQEEVALWLRIAAQTAVISHRGRGSVTNDKNTLTWGVSKGKRHSEWALVVYNKGAEVARHPLPEPMNETEVLEWVAKCLRFELRFMGQALKKIALKGGKKMPLTTEHSSLRYVRNWKPGTAQFLFSSKTGKLFFQDTSMEVQEMIGVKPRVRDAYFSWLKGFDPQAGRPRSTFMRLRNEVKKAYKVDIAVAPPEPGTSNVELLPCKRVLRLQPVERPCWADRIEAKLAA